jgi:hypothetical protein
MKSYILGFIFSCHNPDIFWRNKTIHSLDGLPNKGVFAHNLEHLFGTGLPTQGPETSAGAPGEDNGMNVIIV